MNNAVDSSRAPMPWFGPTEVGSTAQLGAYEPFVDERVVGLFLDIAPRRVLEMARRKEIPAHPIGRARKTWRFRISEIDAHFGLRSPRQSGAATYVASPEIQERKQSWARVQ